MMEELASKLGYKKEKSSCYYPQANGQVEAVNKSLKSILQWTIAQSKNNWHIMLYPSLWAYRTTVKTATGFSPCQLVHGVESVLPIECEIPSWKLAVEILPDTFALEEFLVHLEHLYEHRPNSLVALEVQYDKSVSPRRFSEGDLSFCGIKLKNPWGQESLIPCGIVLTWLNMS